MLHDELWAQIWATAAKREPTCNCAAWLDYTPHRRWQGHPSEGHDRRCERTAGLGEFLCIACVERTLGREITLDDLLPCLGTAATFLMVSRLRGPEVAP